MDATTADPARPEPAAPHRLRMGIGGLLLLTAAMAPTLAFSARIARWDGVAGATYRALALILTGLAVGAARRAGAAKVAAQLGLAGLFVLLIVETEELIPIRFVLLAIFATTIVAPLMIRNALDRVAEGRRGPIRAASEVAWNTGLNLGAFLLFLLVQDAAFSPFPSFPAGSPLIGPAMPVPVPAYPPPAPPPNLWPGGEPEGGGDVR